MKNSKDILRVQQQITLNEDHDEIQRFLYLIVENVLGLSRADIVADKSITLNKEQQ